MLLILLPKYHECKKGSEEDPEICTYVDYIGKEFDISELGCINNNICNNNQVSTAAS